MHTLRLLLVEAVAAVVVVVVVGNTVKCPTGHMPFSPNQNKISKTVRNLELLLHCQRTKYD